MEVKINRDIREYTETMFFGLSLRQFLFSALACGAAVGMYFFLHPYLGTETVSWVCVLGAAPFAVLGFFRYHGMNAEQFIWAWLKSEIMIPKHLVSAGKLILRGSEKLPGTKSEGGDKTT